MFGVVSQQQVVSANQEMVLQFQDADLTSHQTERTLAIVKEQLEHLGAENIQVLSLDNGTLKITYFSDAHVSRIKQTFTDATSLDGILKSKENQSSTVPFEDVNVAYHLDVFEIQNGQDSGWGFDGAIGLEFEPKSDRFLDPNTISSACTAYQYQDYLIQVAYKVRKHIAIQISEPLHKIPEVRAGPIS